MHWSDMVLQEPNSKRYEEEVNSEGLSARPDSTIFLRDLACTMQEKTPCFWGILPEVLNEMRNLEQFLSCSHAYFPAVAFSDND